MWLILPLAGTLLGLCLIYLIDRGRLQLLGQTIEKISDSKKIKSTDTLLSGNAGNESSSKLSTMAEEETKNGNRRENSAFPMNNQLECSDSAISSGDSAISEMSSNEWESNEAIKPLSATEARLQVLERERQLLLIANANNEGVLELVQTMQVPLTVTFSKKTYGPIRTEDVKFVTKFGDECKAAVSIFIDSNKYRSDSFECRLHLRSLSGNSYDVVASLELDPSCSVVHVGRRSEEHDELFRRHYARRVPRVDASAWTERLVVIGGADMQTGKLHKGYFTEQMEYTLDQGAIIRITFRLSIRCQRVSLPPGEIIEVEGKRISICPGLLSSWSEYWSAHFSANWESNVYYVRDDCITFDDFKEMLFVISNIDKPIDDQNFVALLMLADRFEMHGLTRKVERHLIDFAGHSIAFGRLYKVCTDDFDLPLLRTLLMDRWARSPDKMMDELLSDRAFEELSQKAKNLACERYTRAQVEHYSLGRNDDAYSASADEDDW